MGSRWNQRQCQGSMRKTAGRKMRASRVPVQRSQGDPLGRECIQVQPSPPSQRGRKKAVMPRDWRSKSLIQAPKRPTQFTTAWGAAASVAVFKEGSEACQVAIESSRRSETSISSSPRNTFRGRLRVGDRTTEIGFMAWTLPLDGRSGFCRGRAKGAEEESQSSFYYRWAGRGFRG